MSFPLRYAAESPQDRVYFKWIHKRPSRQRRLAKPAAAGGRIRGEEIAIAILKCEVGVGGSMQFDIAGPSGNTLQDHIAMLSYMHADPEWLRGRLLSHEDRGEIKCTMEGLPPHDTGNDFLQGVLDRLLAAFAMDGSTGFCA